MVGTESRGYSNSGRFSEGEYSMPFFCTRDSPICEIVIVIFHIFTKSSNKVAITHLYIEQQL